MTPRFEIRYKIDTTDYVEGHDSYDGAARRVKELYAKHDDVQFYLYDLEVALGYAVIE